MRTTSRNGSPTVDDSSRVQNSTRGRREEEEDKESSFFFCRRSCQSLSFPPPLMTLSLFRSLRANVLPSYILIRCSLFANESHSTQNHPGTWSKVVSGPARYHATVHVPAAHSHAIDPRRILCTYRSTTASRRIDPFLGGEK